jgi:hemoglobin-like flavoprotein
LGQSGYNPELIDRFYEIFLAKSAEIAERFGNTNMSMQKTMLYDSLLFMVSYQKSEAARVHVERIGRTHSRSAHDIPVWMYDVWVDSLMEALSDYDPEFDDQVELSWRVALAPGIEHMKFLHGHS